MNLNDMVLVSVDDHVVEPPDLFEGRLPARYREYAPLAVLPVVPADVMITLQPMNIVQAAADLVWSSTLRNFPT